MSLILDALKRAERERSGTPLLAAADLPSHAPGAARPFRYWRPVGVGVLLIVCGLLAWTLLRDKSVTADQPAVTAAQTPAVSSPPAAVTSAPYVIPGTEAVASLDDLTKTPLEEEAVILPAAAPSASAGGNNSFSMTPAPAERHPATPAPAPIAKPPVSLETPDEKPPSETPSTAPVVDSESPTPPPSVLTQPAPLRKFREMPPEYRADFPALTVEVHVHEREAAQRFVIINGRRYRQGERLAEGPAIIEIVRDGIVLEFRGEKVLYTLTR